MALVPLHRAHLLEEAIHRLFIVEQLSVEVAGVPVEQDATDVEDHRFDRRLRTRGSVTRAYSPVPPKLTFSGAISGVPMSSWIWMWLPSGMSRGLSL